MLINQHLTRMVDTEFKKTIKLFSLPNYKILCPVSRFILPEDMSRDNKECTYVEVRQSENPSLRHIVHAHCHYILGQRDNRVGYIPNGRDFGVHHRKTSADFSDG